jgi:hypothetical protein
MAETALGACAQQEGKAMKSRSQIGGRRLRFEQLESRAMLAVVSFQDGAYPDSSYVGTRDSQMAEHNPYARFGSATSLNVDGDDPASGDDVAALVRWDVSSLGQTSAVAARRRVVDPWPQRATTGDGQAYPQFLQIRFPSS